MRAAAAEADSAEPAAVGPVRLEPDPAGPARSRRRPVYLLAAGLFGVYTAFSLLRAAHVQTAGYDLGIFTQAVRSYAHFQAPMTPIKGPGFNLLGDHFSPALAVLAPLYRLWPSPQLLLVAQAALLAGSAIPVTGLAVRRLGTAGGLAVGVGYGLSWGIQGAVAFDFHEIALGMPLLALAMVALAERRWWAAVWWAVPLVLVKEDLGLTVAAVGGYLLLRRQWRPAAVAALAGVTAFLLSTLLIIPRLDHGFHTYRYWGVVTHAAPNTAGAPGAGDLWRLLLDLPARAVSPAGKPMLVLWVFAVTGFLALRSPLALVAVPTLLWRLVSANPLYWSTGPVHYNAVLMPIVFVALVDALTGLRAAPPAPVRMAARLAPLAVLAICLATLPRFALGQLARQDLGRADPHAAAAVAVAGRIPSGARVAAGNYLVPLLVSRCQVWIFPDVHRRPMDYVIVDTTSLDGVPMPHDQQVAAVASLPSRGFVKVAERDGVQLYRSPGSGHGPTA